MRALIQRVTHASVTIADDTPSTDQSPIRSIGHGFVILLGIGKDDTQDQADRLWSKICKMRIFDDANGKTNLALADVDGEVMVVSQFTLYADCRKGNRPSFTNAGAPAQANELYRYFVDLARKSVPIVATGEFGACMSIDLQNDGPFTIWLDTDEL